MLPLVTSVVTLPASKLSKLVPSAATSLPSTVPDIVMFPDTSIPVDTISSLVEPPVCNFKVLVPASFMNEPLLA